MKNTQKSKRAFRVGELIQSTVASVLRKEVSDPRLKTIAITGADLSPDGKNAIVFFSLLDPTPANINSAEKTFEKAASFFRYQLSQFTELRHTPKLIFKYDPSLMVGERVSWLLRDR